MARGFRRLRRTHYGSCGCSRSLVSILDQDQLESIVRDHDSSDRFGGPVHADTMKPK